MKTLITLVLAIFHATSGLALLMVSAWFIAACSVAGVNFNYVLPAVAVRGLALIRIAAGYGNLFVGHSQMLDRLAGIRIHLFQRLSQQLIAQRSTATSALTQHTEAIASAWIAWISQQAGAICMLALVQVTILVWLPELTPWFVSIVALSLLLFTWMCWRGVKLAAAQVEAKTQFEFHCEHHISSAAVWHLQAESVSIQGQENWHTLDLQMYQTQKNLWLLQSVSWAMLALMLFVLPEPLLGEPMLLIAIVLLLSIRDWLSASWLSQPAMQHSLQAHKQLNELPLQAIPTLPVVGKTQQLTLVQLQPKHRQVPALTLNCHAAGVYLISGSSGAGKSSLLQAIAGLLPSHGQRLRNQIELGKGQVSDWLYLDQHCYCLSDTLFNNLSIADQQLTDQKAKQALQVANLAYLTDLKEWLGQGGRQLSGGELKRLSIARAWLSSASVWLVDEPFEGLSPQQAEVLAQQLNRQAQDRIIIIASHIFPESLNITKKRDLD